MSAPSTVDRPLRGLAAGVLALAGLALWGCGAKPPPPPPPPVVMNVAAHLANDGNPDASGRPSPVVVRVYHLRSEDAFKNLDLDALYFKDKEVLAADLVLREEWTLRPGESHAGRWTMPADVRVIAVIAALRDYRGKPWRVTIPVPAPAANAPPPPPVAVEIGTGGVKLAAATAGK